MFINAIKHYKIKLRDLGYRLVYRVESDKVVLVVLAAGKRERSEVHETAGKRLNARTAQYREPATNEDRVTG